jgi:hypothetical protein
MARKEKKNDHKDPTARLAGENHPGVEKKVSKRRPNPRGARPLTDAERREIVKNLIADGRQGEFTFCKEPS